MMYLAHSSFCHLIVQTFFFYHLLSIKSSTWSYYKQHVTAKLLIGITSNGAITFVSPAFVGSISDHELTRSSGLILKLQGKKNISVMADRGFTIQDQL